jgi:hypothetical protein
VRNTEIDLIRVLRDVVEPCLSAAVRRGDLKRGELDELSLRWRDEHIGQQEGAALTLSVTVDGEVFRFNVVTTDNADGFDPKAAADQLEERLQVFVADVIGRPTRRDFL